MKDSMKKAISNTLYVDAIFFADKVLALSIEGSE